jgi:hypothetical protein
MNKKQIAFAILMTLLSCICLSAQVIEDPLAFSNARLSSLGGSHAALADDIMTLFDNPAGFRSFDFQLLISQLTVGLAGPIFDITNAIIQAGGGADLTKNPAFLTLLSNTVTRIEIAGPISFAYVGDGIGLGIFNWGNLGYQSVGPLAIETTFSENFLIIGGYSFRIELPAQNYIDIGASLKAFYRGKSVSSKSDPEFINALSDPGSLIMGGNFTQSIGGGADVGILYSLGKYISVGVVARNAYTPSMRTPYNTLSDFFAGTGALPAEYGIVPLDLSCGLKISPPLGVLGFYISDLMLLLDYTDMLDIYTHPATARNWFLHINAGLELKLLDVLSIRGGMSGGLFAGGLGLNLGSFQIDASMFGTEESIEPGTRPVYNFILSLAFRL